jgi:hypothetical protein
MPRTVMTIEETVRYHEQKKIEIRTNGNRQIIAAVLRRNDFAVEHCRGTLVNLGLWPDDNDVKSVISKGLAITKVAQRAIAKDEICRKPPPPPNLAITNGVPGMLCKDPIPTKYRLIGSGANALSVNLLMPRLGKINSSVFSLPNLRNLQQRGKAGETQILFTEIYEFLSGVISFGFKLAEEFRDFANLDKLAIENASMRSDRQCNFPLPPNWDVDGLYLIHDVKKIKGHFEVTVQHRFLKISKMVNLKKFKSTNDLIVDMNYSETRATIRSRSQPGVQELLLPYFQVECDDAYLIPLALMDQAVASPLGPITPITTKKAAATLGGDSFGVKSPVLTGGSSASGSNDAAAALAVDSASAASVVQAPSFRKKRKVHDDTDEVPELTV